MIKTDKLTKGEIIWNSVIFLAVTVTALEAPYSFTFNTRIQKWQLIVDGIISLIFLCDVVYHIRQKINKKIVLKTSRKRNKWWFLLSIDILASIPFDIISYMLAGSQGVKLLNLLRFFRLVRIFRITQIVSNLTIVPKSLRMIIYSTSFIIVVNILSCSWHLINKSGTGDNTTDYIMSLYWTITTLTTIGYGDITPTTNAARIFTMVVMILGAGFYGVVIGNVTKFIADSDKHKEQTREKMSDLLNFMKYYNIPERLQHNVFSYYHHLLNKRFTDNDNTIINDLPQALQQELKIFMNIKLIRGLPIFKDCSTSCLKDIASSLEQKYFGPGQTIINIGEIGQEMFIIGHGIVEVILSDGNIVASLHEGQVFGEIALLKETKRNANVRAQSYCDLYKLGKDDFLTIIEKHPELKESMEKVTMKRSIDRKSSDRATNTKQNQNAS